jgi:hypothetical protein
MRVVCQDVDSFVNLDNKVNKNGGVNHDKAQRIQKANGAFVQIHRVEKRQNIYWD